MPRRKRTGRVPAVARQRLIEVMGDPDGPPHELAPPDGAVADAVEAINHSTEADFADRDIAATADTGCAPGEHGRKNPRLADPNNLATTSISSSRLSRGGAARRPRNRRGNGANIGRASS
jgi:hypothetical protein